MKKKNKRHSHRFGVRRYFHWLVCSKCGLVTLKNYASRKAVEKDCDSDWEDEND